MNIHTHTHTHTHIYIIIIIDSEIQVKLTNLVMLGYRATMGAHLQLEL